MPAASRSFECLACAGMLEFSPGSVAVRCPRCEDDRPLPLRFAAQVPARPLDAADARTGALPGHRHERCRACAALLSRPTPGPCPLCGGETVEDASATALGVDGWLPFVVQEHAARTLVTRQLRREGIDATPVRLVALHVPWLVCECVVRGTYEGRRGELTENDGHRRTSWVAVSGVIDRLLEHRRRSVSRSIVGDLAERLEPWDWAFVEPPSAEMSTIVCERSELGSQHLAVSAMGELSTVLAEEARTGIGGDRQEVTAVDGTRSAERFRHVLLPVWFGALADGNTRFTVNGRTGAVVVVGHGIAARRQDLVQSTPPGRGATLVVLLAMAFVAAILLGAALL